MRQRWKVFGLKAEISTHPQSRLLSRVQVTKMILRLLTNHYVYLCIWFKKRKYKLLPFLLWYILFIFQLQIDYYVFNVPFCSDFLGFASRNFQILLAFQVCLHGVILFLSVFSKLSYPLTFSIHVKFLL